MTDKEPTYSKYHVIWSCDTCEHVWEDQSNGDLCTMTPDCPGKAKGFALYAGPAEKGDDTPIGHIVIPDEEKP